MLTKKETLWYWITICVAIIYLGIYLWMGCNGTPDPPPEPCDISYLITETEDGKVATVLKNGAEILRIEATNGEDGKDGIDGIGIDGRDGIDGQDWVLPDTLYLKDLDSGVSKWYAVSVLPLPPTKPNVDTLYVQDVILEGDTWVYFLSGDSLRVHWIYDYKDVNGQPLDTADVWFHIAWQDSLENSYSLKPHQNITQDLSLIMRGFSGDYIVPCVAAFVIKEERRVYSSWAKSTDNGWKARRE